MSVIRHRITLKDGTESIWTANSDDKIICVENKLEFDTVDSFSKAHAIAEGLESWGDGWDECEILMFGQWFRLNMKT